MFLVSVLPNELTRYMKMRNSEKKLIDEFDKKCRERNLSDDSLLDIYDGRVWKSLKDEQGRKKFQTIVHYNMMPENLSILASKFASYYLKDY